MSFHNKISEKELRQAAVQAEAYLQAQLPTPESCTDHGSAQLEQRLQQLWRRCSGAKSCQRPCVWAGSITHATALPPCCCVFYWPALPCQRL